MQPIYYSTDEKMCTQTLKSLKVGQLQELPSFGDDCVVHAAKKEIIGNYQSAVDKIVDGVENMSGSKADHEPEHGAVHFLSSKFQRASYLAIWAIFIMLATIVCTRICDKRQDKKEEKRQM